MALRDISPTPWGAPGTARWVPGLVLSNFSDQSIPLDPILNRYSPSQAGVTVPLNSGVNQIPVPDTTNQRGVYIEPPLNNTVSFNVKWDNGDAGGFINPNGAYLTTFDPNNMPSTLYITVGADLSGTTLSWF